MNDFPNILLDILGSYSVYRKTYFNDPEAWLYDIIEWKDGEGPSEYQIESMVDMVNFKFVAERGPRGIGKTARNAWIILWFSTTRDIDTDWKIGTTASVWLQLTKYLWPEVHKWAKRLNWYKIGREPFSMTKELLKYEMRLKTGLAYAAAPSDPETLEGGHADTFLYLFDEAKIIPDGTWDAVEGMFMSKGDGYWIATSTPGAPVGYFYHIHRRDSGFENWKPLHVTLDDALRAGRIDPERIKQLERKWGKDSALYKTHVLGEFAEEQENGVIPFEWVERSFELWEEYSFKNNKLVSLGVDTAGEGLKPDRTVITWAYKDYWIDKQDVLENKSPMEIVGFIIDKLKGVRGAKSIPIFIDIIGAGGLGVYSRLKELGYNAIGIHGSERSELTDETGLIEFGNLRAEAFWRIRDLLNPEFGYNLKLPKDDDLLGELVTPTFKRQSTGKILIEPKENIKSKIGRSPDKSDSLMYACFGYVNKPVEVGVI